ncbi:MAG: pectate lyase [Candidatus Hydrogenedentes bacterium]|nr:pectate lyase [Candidatus Hydrogenedentota bacterium]
MFAVSGLIQLKSPLEIDHDNITIAGQTAPGDGICLRDAPMLVSANNIIVRFIRSRLGDDGGRESDALSIDRGKNVIIDHCSASWSVDECLSCSTNGTNITNVTVQWCIISEALRNSIHHKGPHSYGSLIRGSRGDRYTYHHNLYAHNASRNPRPGNYDSNPHTSDPEGLLFDFRNNVMYNWGGSRPGYDADSVSVCRYNYVNNYAKPGPNSSPDFIYQAGSKYFRAYYSGNYFNGKIPADQWRLVDFPSKWTKKELAEYKQAKPFPTGPISTDSAQDAYKNVLEFGGACLPVRDPVDTRVVADVRNGTGAIIDHEEQVGGWPEYKTRNVPTDSDKDGMPDTWETAHNLDPRRADDRNGDRDGDGYTNLEEYLNSIAAPVMAGRGEAK